MACFPVLIRADAEAVIGMDDDQGKIADAERAEGFAAEIEVTGGIEDVELFVEPVGMEERALNADLAFFFSVVIIGCRGAVGNTPKTIDDAAGN